MARAQVLAVVKRRIVVTALIVDGALTHDGDIRKGLADRPLAFLDHHFKQGNSLVGSDIEDIEELESDANGEEDQFSLAEFGATREGTIERLMDIYSEFLAIENEDLDDVKEMERKYEQIQEDLSNPGHFREYTKAELREYVEGEGLDVEGIWYCDYWPQSGLRRLLELAVPSLRRGITLFARKP